MEDGSCSNYTRRIYFKLDIGSATVKLKQRQPEFYNNSVDMLYFWVEKKVEDQNLSDIMMVR